MGVSCGRQVVPAPGTASRRSACRFSVSKLCRPENGAACPCPGSLVRSDLPGPGRPRFAASVRLVPSPAQS